MDDQKQEMLEVPEAVSVRGELERAWKEVKSVRDYRRRRYAVAASFTALGVFLLFLSLAFLLEGVPVMGLSAFWVFLALIVGGSISFGYGFYRMGVS